MIEYKFKEKGQLTNWEELPVICTSEESAMKEVIAKLMRLYQMVEIRWNYNSSEQGHYITGNCSRYE